MIRLRMMTAAALGVAMALAPVSGVAKDNHPGKGNGQHRHVRGETHHIIVDRDRDRDSRERRHHVDADCPPGLAKKHPRCVPPGQARKGYDDWDDDHRDRYRDITVGDILDLDHIHIIRNPGLYGLGNPPDGDRYAIVDGRLVRVESDTGRLLSIIRLVSAILD